jgi:Recombination endonuclease VII
MKRTCARGHLFTPENTVYSLRTQRRMCIECQRKQCANGHDLIAENTRVNTEGELRCRLCAKAYTLERMGISLEIYNNLLEAQNGQCANKKCGHRFVDNDKICVDHDHSCCPANKCCIKCIRGLLCNRCNMVLGLTYDSVNCLKGLQEYLIHARNLQI